MEAPANAIKINYLEGTHCVRDAGAVRSKRPRSATSVSAVASPRNRAEMLDARRAMGSVRTMNLK